MNRASNRFSRWLGLALWLAAHGAMAASVPLPPLAKVEAVDATSESWRQSGEISGTVAVAHGDFSAALAHGGWVLQKTIILGREPQRSELMMWKRGSTKILLMIWEKSAGTCGFSWGYDLTKVKGNKRV